VHPSARFLLVGGGPLADQLRARIAAHGLGDVVRLLGERADVPDVLEALDALLLTSHREGMPNAVLEAMAAGLPCVVTDAGGAPEIVLDGVTGYVCPRGNAEGLTASLVRLIERPDERRRLGRAGQHRAVTEFSVARLVTRTQALYQTLLAEQDPAHAPARQHRVAV
jgi:glycosyltransferase involved in cell wall biosynthesis